MAITLKKLLDGVKKNVKNSAKIVMNSKKLLSSVKKEVTASEKKYAEKDAVINNEIAQITKNMDEKLIYYLKKTE